MEKKKEEDKGKNRRRTLSHGIKTHVVRLQQTDVSEEHMASILRIEE
jgi:hypothetical protein